jgi:succinate dehydrogenase/fumarate reductase flavoprotein subunit
MTWLHLGQTPEVEYVEAWDIIVIGDGPAALRAAESAAKAGCTTLMMAADALGSGNTSAFDGIAAPLKENSTKSHRDDTIRAGGFLCDQDIVSKRVSQAIRQVDLLERWGVIFRRDPDGIPFVRRGPGHTLPRLTGAGDALSRECQQVLEEQCMRHGVVRRGNQIPMELVHTDNAIHGLIALDMSTGILNSIQAKAVIIADGGYEGVWTGTATGLGLDLAMKAGLAVKNLEFVAWAPLAVAGTNIVLPLGMLADGAKLHLSSGAELDVDQHSDTTILANAIGSNPDAVLDARHLGDSSIWWAQTAELISTRLGIDISRQTIPIHPRVATTLGGIAIDEHGRAIIGKWSRWFTGLYAAGDAASSGMHGAGLVAGNRLLDAMAGGAAAGEHAATFASESGFTGRSALETCLGACEADLDLDMVSSEGDVQRTSPLFTKLSEIMNQKVSGQRDSEGLNEALDSLKSLEKDGKKLHLDDHSRLFNTNLLEATRLKAGIRLAIATTQSALARTESRGTHQRTDFDQSDSEWLHHSLVDSEGNTSTLALRKGSAGAWILAPEA